MKIRFKIFTTIVSALVCFGLVSIAQAQEGDVGNGNTVEGFHALNNDSPGSFNTALGWFSQGFNGQAVDGFFNTAAGAGSLDLNFGDSNTAFGTAALLLNLAADRNTAVGTNAMVNNDFTGTVPSTAEDNTAVGFSALSSNLDGGHNTAVGSFALRANTDEFDNTFVGFAAGFFTTGGNNTAMGSLDITVNPGITSGHDNTVVGNNAGAGITSGSDNTIVGADAGTSFFTLDNNVYIGRVNPPAVFESNTIRIGSGVSGLAHTAPTLTTHFCFIDGIIGAAVGAAAVPVRVNANGQLGTLPSTERVKKDIESMGKTSEAIFSLRPVSFHYKGDPINVPCWGLIAEEVAKVNPDLIVLDKEGKPMTVRYDDINVMLLNEFLKEHKKVEQQQATISELKNEVQTVVAQLKEQAAQIQKVSAQLEVNKPAAKVVVNKP